MTIPTTLIVVLMTTLLMTGAQNPSYRRCYTCRSRGELGDCKDNFIPPPPFNASNPGASLLRHVQESPCYSGWCYKQIDGDIWDSSNTAVERGCMQRKPSDNEERCSYVLQNFRAVFMCFCEGDLCNGVGISAGNVIVVTIMILVGRIMQWRPMEILTTDDAIIYDIKSWNDYYY